MHISTAVLLRINCWPTVVDSIKNQGTAWLKIQGGIFSPHCFSVSVMSLIIGILQVAWPYNRG
jgi:hypothetical protein